MDYITLLPSPGQVLSSGWSLLLNSSLIGRTRRASEARLTPLSFDVNAETAFFPPQPLRHLPEPFTVWEEALEEAREILHLADDDREEAIEHRPAGEEWRANVRSWSVLSTDDLAGNLRLQQRAHYVLAWLVHSYVHSMPPSQEGKPTLVPRSLALPLVEVSRVLGIAPVLTFADTVLWNWELVDPSRPVSIDNMNFVNLFSGTEDERNFYRTSAMADLRGVELMRIIDDYNNMRDVNDLASISKISRELTRVAGIIEDISDIIQAVRNVVDPHVFYWDIRPWWEGSDAKGPTEPGWIYEGVPDTEKLDLSGPSAGQSSVIHALDIFLDIDHKLQQRRYPAPSDVNKKADHGFMDRMRRYMPGKHREYLAYLAATPRPIRELARRTPALREPYDAAVMALKKLRDLHMRIAVLYVVTMSRSTPPGSSPACPVLAMMERMQARQASGQGPVRGTGGNELSLLLKSGRDATRRAVLKDN